MICTKLHHLIDIRGCSNTFKHCENSFVYHRYQDPVAHKARRINAWNWSLSDLLGQLDQLLHSFISSLQPTDNFHKLHHGHRIEEVPASKMLLTVSRKETTKFGD